MKIAQVAPLTESVPPKLYGGTERVVSYLADELARQGHSVTLFASGDSRAPGELVRICPEALRWASGWTEPLVWHLLMLEQVAQRATDFDVIHFHVSHVHLSLARRLHTAHLTTMHGRLDLPELDPLYREFSDIPVVAISDAQRRPLLHANWIGTVYHGLPSAQLRFCPKPEGYFAFLGRVSREKRVDRAIAIARACGCRLRIAAKVDPADAEYFEREIRGLLDDPLVEFIGEIGEAEKSDFLGGATALLFPIDWAEPFGLVMIEALACGTPVIAFRGGSVVEVVEDGITGFVVDTVEQAIDAARRVGALDRRACRTAFEQRFSAGRMASQYVQLYHQVIDQFSSTPVA